MSSTVPTRDGYTFLGWATTEDGAAVYSTGDSYSNNANVVLYAAWKTEQDTYTVTYNANGGIGAPSAVITNKGLSVNISDTIPTREGFSFLG